MAVKRKPLSATTIKTLKTKAKKSKLFNLADLKAMARVNKLISRGKSGTFDRDIITRASKRKRK